jgi:hypothetical protein
MTDKDIAKELVRLAKAIVAAKTPSQFRKWQDLTDEYRKKFPMWPEGDYPVESLYNKKLFICIEMKRGRKYYFSVGYPLGGALAIRNIATISRRDYELMNKDPIKGMVSAFGAPNVKKFLERYNFYTKYPRVDWDAIIEDA